MFLIDPLYSTYITKPKEIGRCSYVDVNNFSLLTWVVVLSIILPKLRFFLKSAFNIFGFETVLCLQYNSLRDF